MAITVVAVGNRGVANNATVSMVVPAGAQATELKMPDHLKDEG